MPPTSELLEMTGAPRRGRAQTRGTYSAVKLVSPAEPNAVTALRHRATTFATENGADPELAADVALAVSEAITNVVKYAYGPEGGTVEFSAAADKGWLEIRVRDQGNGFSDGNSSGLGIGLTLIADLCTDLAITQESTGTEVRMRWLLPAAD